MPSGRLHILQTRPVIERRRNKRRTHSLTMSRTAWDRGLGSRRGRHRHASAERHPSYGLRVSQNSPRVSSMRGEVSREMSERNKAV